MNRSLFEGGKYFDIEAVCVASSKEPGRLAAMMESGEWRMSDEA